MDIVLVSVAFVVVASAAESGGGRAGGSYIGRGEGARALRIEYLVAVLLGELGGGHEWFFKHF